MSSRNIASFFSRGGEKRASEHSVALPAGSEEQEIETAPITGASPEETKRLRGERAEQIKSLSAADFNANKAALIAELKTIKNVDSGWCNEAAGILRTRKGAICEVIRENQSKRRSIAWSYVISFLGAVTHAVICLQCFLEVITSFIEL